MNRIRVLCVDDNIDILGMYRMVLEHSEHTECVGCLTSTRTLTHDIEQTHADIVLLDLSIPGEQTLKALEQANARNRHFRCILVSGYDDEETVRSALQAGARRCISKDIDTNQLVEAICTTHQDS